MAEAILEIVLGNLSSLIQKELRLFWDFNQDLERLLSMLTTIKATLEDAEEKQFSDGSIKDWLRKLKDAAYELDDIMDEYAYKASGLEYQGVKCGLSDKVQCSCLSTSHPKHVFGSKIANKMKRMSEKLEEIVEERTKFHLIETVSERRRGVTEWRQNTSFIDESQVFGRETDKDKIVDFLIGDASQSEDLSVFPIIGLGGLGKTTLAQLIFNHERVVNHFEPRIWVCVSEDFSLKRMTKAIIEAASGQASEDLDAKPLKRRLQDLLQRKRYLLVLDDVWDDKQENWQKLKHLLACGAKGASVLVTTRLQRVAVIMGTIFPYELQLLSCDSCWALFKNQAFGPNEEYPEELVAIGQQIVQKCMGVPLAAKALGGLLRFKRSVYEWLNVMRSSLWELSHNENSIMPALRLCYLNLPIKLRQCFAYCAIFPKDEKIRKQYLIELWMVNGFISSDDKLDAEDVGDAVWNELYCRSFFQDIERNEFGKVTSFKMHDLVHDLAQFFAEDVCCISDDNGVTALPLRICHLSDHRWTWNSLEEAISIKLQEDKSLRTCILPYRHTTARLFPDVLKCYSLRVLRCQLREELSSSIGDLKHLRYLNLSGGDFKTLPESLCKLWHLQILKLDGCQFLQKLPSNLIRLKSLQQISVNDCISLSSLPPQIGKLTSLRNLSTYIVGNERGFLLAELGPLKLKGDLHIKHLGKVKSVMDARDANMSGKQLNQLWLSWDRNNESKFQGSVEHILEELKPNTEQLQSLGVVGYKGVHFPQWISIHSLRYLELEDCERCLELPALGKLPSLKNLRISNMIRVEYLYEEAYDGTEVFRALEYLFLEKLPNLIRLSREDGKKLFPRLSKLEIGGCPKLLRLSSEDGEDMFPDLSTLKITQCPELSGLPSLPSINCLHIQGKCNQDLLSSIHKLSSLESLCFEDNEEITIFPHGMLQNLTSLEELYFRRLFKLELLPLDFLLNSLKKLEIVGCPNFNESSGLHEALPRVTALHSLGLCDLPNLESLPDCFEELTLLRELSIGYCSKLKCLPTSLKSCKLESLTIFGCPEFEKRCLEKTGEDWPKIEHIPHFEVIRTKH